MDVSGSLERNELMAALRLVSCSRGTGTLVATTTYTRASVGFEAGQLLYATASIMPKLGDLLVEQGLVTREKLDAALWVQKQDKEWRALGRVLLDVRLLSLAQVEAAVETQILKVLDEILRWEGGTFRFEHGLRGKAELVPPPCRDLGQYEVRIAILRASPLAAAADGPAA